MVNKIERVLKTMVGEEVNVSLTGVVSTLMVIEDFDYSINKNQIHSDVLVLRNDVTEQEIHITLDEVREVNFDGEEIVLVMENMSMLQIWKDLV